MNDMGYKTSKRRIEDTPKTETNLGRVQYGKRDKTKDTFQITVNGRKKQDKPI